mmetsp:Transcript_56121/g.156377  ORF Transcript_56121/g.156377 Transcript_56121/m.156377 type:complete len:168 (-) Transcript_56121:141-644(-)
MVGTQRSLVMGKTSTQEYKFVPKEDLTKDYARTINPMLLKCTRSSSPSTSQSRASRYLRRLNLLSELSRLDQGPEAEQLQGASGSPPRSDFAHVVLGVPQALTSSPSPAPPVAGGGSVALGVAGASVVLHVPAANASDGRGGDTALEAAVAPATPSTRQLEPSGFIV